jgi:hypothetical protein
VPLLQVMNVHERSPKVHEGPRRFAIVSEGSPNKNVRKPTTTVGNVEKSGVMKEYCSMLNKFLLSR